jgi:hypothetical protein
MTMAVRLIDVRLADVRAASDDTNRYASRSLAAAKPKETVP